MHFPSRQLLRALLTSISMPTSALSRTGLSSPISQITPRCSTTLPSTFRRYNSSNSANNQQPRPVRMVPRSHTVKPSTHDREPEPQETARTDINELNILGNVPPPTTAVEASLDDGFQLDNGMRTRRGDGVLLVGGEAFAWRPWANRGSKAGMVNRKGQFEVDEEVWGVLGLVWPRPDLLIIGLGASMFPISPETKKYINSLGIRIEIMDTRNAAAEFNMLATERGVTEIAAALIPIGWKGS